MQAAVSPNRNFLFVHLSQTITKTNTLLYSVPPLKQNVMLEGKPLYDAVVEISFDSFEDFNTFFNSENYLNKVHPDEPKFFDISNYIAMATNETIIKAGA